MFYTTDTIFAWQVTLRVLRPIQPIFRLVDLPPMLQKLFGDKAE